MEYEQRKEKVEQNTHLSCHTYLQKYDVCATYIRNETGFHVVVCLWENEFSTTFFIFHIIYQKQINININAEVERRTENLCEIQVPHLSPPPCNIFMCVYTDWIRGSIALCRVLYSISDITNGKR